MTRLVFARTLAGLGALISGYYVATGVWEWLAPFGAFFGAMVGDFGGGVGAVSVGFPGSWLLILLVSAIANRSIARWARVAGQSIRRLHRTHTILVAIAFAAMVVLLAMLLVDLQRGEPVVGGPAFPTMLSIYVLAFMGQLAVLATLLAVFAISPRLSPAV